MPALARPGGDGLSRPQLRTAGGGLLVFAGASLLLLAQTARLQRGLYGR